MTTFFRIAALAALLAIGSLVPASAQKAPAADAERIAAAKDLFVAMGSAAQFDTAIDTMTKGMAGIFRQQHPGKQKEIDEVFGLLRNKFHARSSEVIEMIAPLWAEKFTVAEMKEIAAFFATPIGRKLVASQPEIMQRSMQVGMAWGQRIGAEVEQEARRELKRRGVDL